METIHPQARICRVTTRDGCRLEGLFIPPAEVPPVEVSPVEVSPVEVSPVEVPSVEVPPVEARAAHAATIGASPIDVVVLVHGTGSHFYGAGVLETFANRAAGAGFAVLRINTRGHDAVSSTGGPRGSHLGGAAFERIDECGLDLEAWCAGLQEFGYRRLALVGHSMGAVKSIYASAHASPDSCLRTAVARVVAISPPRFCHRQFQEDPRTQPFRDDYFRAEALIANGHGDTLMNVAQPLPLLVTAAGFVAKYGPHDNFDFLRALPNVPCPTLVVLGEETVLRSPAFHGLPGELQARTHQQPLVSFHVVAGGDINYSNDPAKPCDLAIDWLKETH